MIATLLLEDGTVIEGRAFGAETDAVFECLERAVEERDPAILDLPCKPIWDGLRQDRRFTALLSRMHLA